MGGTERSMCMCWHLNLPRRTALLRIPCMQECVSTVPDYAMYRPRTSVLFIENQTKQATAG